METVLVYAPASWADPRPVVGTRPDGSGEDSPEGFAAYNAERAGAIYFFAETPPDTPRWPARLDAVFLGQDATYDYWYEAAEDRLWLRSEAGAMSAQVAAINARHATWGAPDEIAQKAMLLLKAHEREASATASTGPRWEHPCVSNACHFLGTHREYDIWHCPDNDALWLRWASVGAVDLSVRLARVDNGPAWREAVRLLDERRATASTTTTTTATEGTTMFNVNDRVTLQDTEAMTGWAGLTARVIETPEHVMQSTYVTLDEGQKRPDGSTAMSFFWPTSALRLIETEATALQPLQQVVEDLKAHIATVERLWNEDRARIGEALREAAIEQNWCSEYEDQMERLNARLNRGILDWQRQREYEVSIHVVQTYVTTVSVTATSEDEARGYVENGDVEWSVEGCEPDEEDVQIVDVEEA